MLGLSPWVSFLAVLVAAGTARLLPAQDWRRTRRLLDGWAAPVSIGVLSTLLSTWLWGSLTATPVIHDESAYLLQAELFARLRWTGAAPPIPEFFRQLHVFVEDALASKYPPGNSIVLALGALIGLPGLPVVIMNGCVSGLVFVLAKRLSGSMVAVLTWIVWQSSFPWLYDHANYMSEGVSSLTWLVTWWGILRWRDGHGRRWLAVAAGATAWCIITRPLTGVALGAVALVVVARRCKRERAWRDLTPAVAVAVLLLILLPIWNWRTTGDAWTTPLSLFSQKFTPFDKLGFGARADERPRHLPRDQWMTSTSFYQEHARHTLPALPVIAWQRLTMLDRDAWYEWRGGLRVFALVGLLVLSAEAWVPLAAFVLQFLLYLTFAHPPWYTLYYLECAPLLAFVTALGIARLLTLASVTGGHGERKKSLPSVRARVLASVRERWPSADAADDERAWTAVLLVSVAGVIAAAGVAVQVRLQLRSDHAYYDAFDALVRELPDRRAIVFVRYSDKHPDGLSLVRNVADLESAPVWTVYDRGGDNARLLALTPGRVPYLFDESSWTLRRLQPASTSKGGQSFLVVPAGGVRERREARRPH